MKIESIEAREIAMKLSNPFETSFGIIQNRRIILIELRTDQGSGWGEVVAGEGPFYNPETTDTAWLVLRDFIAQILMGRSFNAADEVLHAMAPIRGHEMAKAAVESAAWDAFARQQGVPLHQLLGGTQQDICSGVSLGIHSDIQCLLDKIAEELSAGYQRIKLKIKPGKDVAVVAAVRKHYPDIALTVDANSAYTLQDTPLLKQLDEFSLTYIEQPLEWNEIYQHAALQKTTQDPHLS